MDLEQAYREAQNRRSDLEDARARERRLEAGLRQILMLTMKSGANAIANIAEATLRGETTDAPE